MAEQFTEEHVDIMLGRLTRIGKTTVYDIGFISDNILVDNIGVPFELVAEFRGRARDKVCIAQRVEYTYTTPDM